MGLISESFRLDVIRYKFCGGLPFALAVVISGKSFATACR